MLKFNNRGKTIAEAFNVNDEDIEKVDFFLEFYARTKNASQTVERIWIDETVSDNVKAMAIFSLGRAYQQRRNNKRHEKGGDYAGD